VSASTAVDVDAVHSAIVVSRSTDAIDGLHEFSEAMEIFDLVLWV